jgi:hypothetical protein
MDKTSTRTDIWNYIKANHYIESSPGNGAPIIPRACAIQNVSDTHHDGLNPDAARKTMPTGFTNAPDLSEDDFLAEYLYDLDKVTPKTTTAKEYLNSNYHCFFRIPLIHGETTNVGSTGEPQYPDRNSVLETIFDELGLANQNIYISKDFGFPAMQYDFTYFKNRQIYIGYRPAQENDAAGKPTLTSSKAFEFGFQSPNIKVDFIWTIPEIDPGFTLLPRWTGGTPSEDPTLNYSLLDYETRIGWDPAIPGPSANALKSQTFFVKPLESNPSKSIVYRSNSEWTSKSGKELKAYQQFNNGAQEILKKNPLALGDPITSANKAITATDFDEFHSLAKRSGDALTAYIKPTNPQYFIRLNPKSANVSGPTEKFKLTDFAFMYQTHDRLAAAGALTRKVEMVILESPRESGGDSVFSLFIRKDMLNVGKMYNTIKKTYYDPRIEPPSDSPYSKLTEYLKKYLKKYLETKNDSMENNDKRDGIVVSEDHIKDIDEIIKSVDPTWSNSKYDGRVVIDPLRNKIVEIDTKLKTDIARLNPINNDADIVSYIKLQMLKKTINDIDNDFRMLVRSEHIYITTFLGKIADESINKYKPNPDNTDTGMKQFITNVVYPFNEYKSCMKTYKALNALAAKITALPIEGLIANIGDIAKLNDTTLKNLDKTKPNTQITATSVKRITGRFNPLKLFATSKDRLNIILSTDLQEFFGFPELLLKLWDKLPEDAFPNIYNYYHNAYNYANTLATANPNNHDLELIAQCLGFVFREQYIDATTFKNNLMEFAEHKDLLLTEKKTKDDFMFELPSVLLSKKKRIALEDKKNTILSKITNFTNRMLGRIVPPRGGKKTRVRRGKIVGKRTKKYRGGGKRKGEDDGDDQLAKRQNDLNELKRKERDDDDDNNGTTKKIRPPPTPRDIELLFRILGVFVFFLTFLRDERDKLKIKNPAIQTFCDNKIDKINAFVKKLYNDHFDILIRLFPDVNLGNMFHYGPGKYSNDIYKYDPNYYDPKYEKYINNMTNPDNTNNDTESVMSNDDDTRIDLFYYDNNIPLEDKIVYLFAQYIPFFIKNNEEKNPFDEYEIFKMLYDNTMTSVIMYIIGTYIGDNFDQVDQVDQDDLHQRKRIAMETDKSAMETDKSAMDDEPSAITEKDKSVKNYLPNLIENISDLEPDANVSAILRFLPVILNLDNFNKIDDSKLQAFLEKIPISDRLPNIINTKIFDNYAINIQQQFHNVTIKNVTIKNVNTYIDSNNLRPSYNKLSIYPDPNHDIEIFKRGLYNVNKNRPFQPPSMKTGVFNMPNYSNSFYRLFELPKQQPVTTIGGYKSSRKNKKYRKPRKYRYR